MESSMEGGQLGENGESKSGIPVPPEAMQEVMTRLFEGESFASVISTLTPEKLKSWGIDPVALVRQLQGKVGPAVDTANETNPTVWDPPENTPGVEIRRRTSLRGPPQQRVQQRAPQPGTRQPAGAPRNLVPVHAAPSDEDPEEAERMRNALNVAGTLISQSAMQIDGLFLGITFRPGGRKVEVSGYIVGDNQQIQEVARHEGGPRRLGFLIETVLAQSYDLLEEDDDDSDEYEDGDEDEYEEDQG